MTKEEYETIARQLVGRTIKKVFYHEVDYSDDKYHFFDDSRFDTLDYGLEFELDTGKFLFITWGSEFYQYGISIVDGRLSSIVTSSRYLDVNKSKRWQNLISRRIDSLEIFWCWCEKSGNPGYRIYYPQDLLLRFEGNYDLVISALEIRDDDFAMGMMDNITVFDDIEMAKKHNCLQKT